MSKGRLKTCIKLLVGIFVVFLYAMPSWADDDSVAQMQQELRAMKAELESLRAEMRADKETIKAHDDELLASKQEFSQLSSEVRNWKADPQAVETLKDQIKKELGFVPNVYNELANKVRLGFELRTRAEFENNWHTVVAHNFDPLNEDEAAHPVSGDFFEVGRNTGPTLAGGGGDEDQFLVLNRVRFNIDADVHEHLRTFVQIQDSRFWGVENGVVGFQGDNFGGAGLANVAHLDDNNRIDLHQAYVDIRKFFNPNLTLRLGRQEIIWGTPGPGDPGHRMMGDFGWSNIGITWDALRALYDTERYGFEAFGAIVRHSSLANSAGALFSTRDRDDDDRQVYGGMFTFKKLIPNGNLQLMYLMDNDQFAATADRGGVDETPGGTNGRDLRGSGSLEVHDVGARFVGKIGKNIDYFGEGHYQAGKFRGRAHEAMAGVIGAGYQFNNFMWKPRIGYEFDYSPGDGGIERGKHRTFHNFYPTNHAHYGYADLMSWKNMVAHRLQAKVWPTKKLTAWVDFWNFSLQNSNDAWYNAAQIGLLRQSPTATSDIGNHLANEIDLTLNYSLYKNVGILAGYSRFVSGTVIRKLAPIASPIASEDDTDWGFLQVTVSF